jgi:hypothetical protein
MYLRISHEVVKFGSVILVMSWGKEFYICIQRLIQFWLKCVDNEEDFMENNLIIAKYAGIINVNFILIGITFSEKKWRHYFVPLLIDYTLSGTNTKNVYMTVNINLFLYYYVTTKLCK